jgi:hypothetical protein
MSYLFQKHTALLGSYISGNTSAPPLAMGTVCVTNPTQTNSIRGEMRSAIRATYLRLEIGP